MDQTTRVVTMDPADTSTPDVTQVIDFVDRKPREAQVDLSKMGQLTGTKFYVGDTQHVRTDANVVRNNSRGAVRLLPDGKGGVSAEPAGWAKDLTRAMTSWEVRPKDQAERNRAKRERRKGRGK